MIQIPQVTPSLIHMPTRPTVRRGKGRFRTEIVLAYLVLSLGLGTLVQLLHIYYKPQVAESLTESEKAVI